MKNRFFPIFLSLHNKDCLVVGGGAVAYQKIQALMKSGARVHVVATSILPAIRRFKAVKISKRPFRAADLGSNENRPWLVVAATDDAALNQTLFRLCQKKHIWVNTVDKPATCNYIFPAVVRRGPLHFAISTGGASPALAKHLRKKLAQTFGPEVGRVAAWLGKLRPLLSEMPMAARAKFVARHLKKKSFFSAGSRQRKAWELALRRAVKKS